MECPRSRIDAKKSNITPNVKPAPDHVNDHVIALYSSRILNGTHHSQEQWNVDMSSDHPISAYPVAPFLPLVMYRVMLCSKTGVLGSSSNDWLERYSQRLQPCRRLAVPITSHSRSGKEDLISSHQYMGIEAAILTDCHLGVRLSIYTDISNRSCQIGIKLGRIYMLGSIFETQTFFTMMAVQCM